MSEHLRRDTQTELLRRDAYEEFTATARDVDDALRDHTTVVADYVEATIAYKTDQTDVERENDAPPTMPCPMPTTRSTPNGMR